MAGSVDKCFVHTLDGERLFNGALVVVVQGLHWKQGAWFWSGWLTERPFVRLMQGGKVVDPGSGAMRWLR